MDSEYNEDCTCCGLTITVFTQADRFPEYYTEVDVVCTCGNKVRFELPVN